MRDAIAKNFKSSNKGLGKVLGRLEQQIMEVLWESAGLTGKEVLSELRRSREIAMTTVFTVLDRLVKKKLLNKKKGESFYVFTPIYSKEEFTRGVSEEVFKGVMDLMSGSAVNYFVDMLAESNPDELDRLSSLISDKKKELEI